MIDHVSPEARLAEEKPVVHYEMPNWSLEIFGCLLFVMAAIVITVLGQLMVVMNERTDAREEAAFWRELALAPDAGAICSTTTIPDEWKRPVAAECEILADLKRRINE